MPNFERFSRGLVPLKSDPTLTIHKRGLLSLNRTAYDCLGAPNAVQLLYDRQARIVGLRRITSSADDAVFVRAATRSASGPWVVSAMAFVRYYEIDTEISRRWPAYLEEDVLCVDLSSPGEVATTNRARRSAAETD